MNRIGLAAVAALALSATTHAALAQRPVLTESVDEPGRSPYQQTILFNQDTTSCPNQFYCQVLFPAVPAGKRLVVTYASAWFSMVVAGDAGATVGADGNLFGLYVDLPTPKLAGSLGSIYSSGSSITAYIQAGSQPTVFISGSNVLANNTARASVVGYLVSVP